MEIIDAITVLMSYGLITKISPAALLAANPSLASLINLGPAGLANITTALAASMIGNMSNMGGPGVNQFANNGGLAMGHQHQQQQQQQHQLQQQQQQLPHHHHQQSGGSSSSAGGGGGNYHQYYQNANGSSSSSSSHSNGLHHINKVNKK
jgi:hypothetical protein